MIVSNRTVFWDGDNFVVVTKNCTRAMAKRIMAAFAEADLGETAVMEDAAVHPIREEEELVALPDDVAGDTMAEENDSSMPRRVTIPSTRYAGMTAEEVLQKEGDKGFGNLSYLLDRVDDPGIKEEIKKELDKYFVRRFQLIGMDEIKEFSLSECEQFFRIFGKCFTSEDAKRLNSLKELEEIKREMIRMFKRKLDEISK